MHVVINSDKDLNQEPLQQEVISTQSTVILNLLLSLGYKPSDLPVADLLRRYHQLKGNWLVLSPIHWQASHNNAVIVAVGKELGLSELESKRYFQLFSDYLAVEGIKLHYHDAETWLLCIDDKPLIKAQSPYQLINHPLMEELSQLDSSMYWQKFFTESQMFFASLNPPSLMNGLWAWGGAALRQQETINLCVDEALFELAKALSLQPTLYNPALALQNFDIVLLSHLEVLSKSHQEQLKKMSAHWYWNNTAYTSLKANWFTRLWRYLIHAY